MLERGIPARRVSPLHQRLAGSVEAWPHFPPPEDAAGTTVLEVALAGTPEEHVERVRGWAREVWGAWSDHHDEVAALVSRHLDLT